MKTPTASITPQAKVDSNHFLDAFVIVRVACIRDCRIRPDPPVPYPDFHTHQTVQTVSFFLVQVDRACNLLNLRGIEIVSK